MYGTGCCCACAPSALTGVLAGGGFTGGAVAVI
eukprot:COSAG06_NODE_53080_length_302_cov_0.748768_1_plen_32_part_01